MKRATWDVTCSLVGNLPDMAKTPITLMGYRCERCAHQWVPRLDREPSVCPSCKSPYWNRPRRPRIKPSAVKAPKS